VYLAADSCIRACSAELPNVEFEHPALPEFDGQTSGGIVDLTGLGSQEGGPKLRIRTDAGVVICRPKSTIVVFDPDAPVDPFRAEPADGIRPGDRICVLSRSFFEAVREHLGSSAAAAADVRAYHHFVADKISKYAGASFTEKASRIVRAMALKGCIVSESRVGDWIRADRWLKEGDTTVRPHAPWHYHDFRAFLEVLGAPEPLITRFWQFGVLATRSLRLSAALQFYELCIAILTKFQDMVAQHPNKMSEFSEIRARAEATVAGVTAVVGSDAPQQHEPEVARARAQNQLKLEGI
jgi:hypothetical protein